MIKDEIKKIEKKYGKHYAGVIVFLFDPKHAYFDDFSVLDLFHMFFAARRNDLDTRDMFDFVYNRISCSSNLNELIKVMEDDHFSEICAWQTMLHYRSEYWEKVMDRAAELADTVKDIKRLKKFQGQGLSPFCSTSYESKRKSIFLKALEKYKETGGVENLLDLREIADTVFRYEKESINEAIFEKIKNDKVELAAVIADDKYDLGDEYREKARNILRGV